MGLRTHQVQQCTIFDLPAQCSSNDKRHYYKKPQQLPIGLGKFLLKSYLQILLHIRSDGGKTVEELNATKDHITEAGALKARFIYPNLKLRVYTTGMRQNRLAKLVGIDEAYLSRIINGVRVPGKQMQQQIAEVLGCDPEWLFQQAAIETPARCIGTAPTLA
jgi:hypothetical protein